MSKPVLFSSFRPLSRSENLSAIYHAYPGDKVHILSYAPNYKNEVLSGKYDLMVTDDFPSCTPGKCIVIWHGIQGGKRIGLDQPGHPYFSEETAKMITYIISAGTGTIDIWHQCTGVQKDHILPLGMPRTDEYAGYRPENHDKTMYLYVPTFRDKGETPFPAIDWAYIDSQLTDDEMLVIKAHPWQADVGIDQVTNEIDSGMYKHIGVIPSGSPTSPWLYIADVVITDYSSIMFDAFLLDKPVVLFEKNHGYTETRGMYFDYPYDYCSFIAIDEIELLASIRYRTKHPYLTGAEHRIRDITSDMCDGHACERLCNLIEGLR